MNAMATALKKKVGKVSDAGGSFIAKRIMLRPNIDASRGERADTIRQSLIRRRESIKNDKEMGY